MGELMKIQKLIRVLVGAVVLVSGMHAHAQIGSEAAEVVQGRPECKATIYTMPTCPPCNALKQRIRDNPEKYGCNAIEWVDCASDNRRCSQAGVRTVPVVSGKLCSDCDKGSPKPPSPPSGPGPQPPKPPSGPDNACTGQAKFKCPSKNPNIAYSCCLKGCDTSSSTEACLSCPSSYKMCTPSSCPAGKVCVNEKDAKGCEKDFTCKDDPQSPPPGEEDGVCELITDPVTGEQKIVCRKPGAPTEPDFPPVSPPKDPEVPDTGGGPSDPSDPPAPPQCDNPCPSAANPNNCCKPTEGCYQGSCNAYDGCAGCKQGQVCKPTDRYPFYGCFLKEEPKSETGGNG
jgi:hypothetical protein